MPALFSRFRAVRTLAANLTAVGLLALCAATTADAATPPASRPQGVPARQSPPASDEAGKSALDGPLFFQLLIGEIELLEGAPGAAYEALLDAARKTRDAQLFKRVTDIALRSRAGDQALIAARAWRDAVPTSVEAHRYLIQILVTLNRLPDVVEPLRSWLSLTPTGGRSTLIALLPQLLMRNPDPTAGARLLDDALQPFAAAPETRLAVRIARGRAWLAAGDRDRAFTLAQEANASDPASDAPLLLALGTMPQQTRAEAWVVERLQARPSDAVRMVYARALGAGQRYADAIAQLETVTRNQPGFASAWLMLGALHLELRHGAEGASALENFLRLTDSGSTPASTAADSAEAVAHAIDGDAADTPEQARMQAWLMLAQAAEQQGDYQRAESWLAKVDSPQRALEVQQRRASLLSKQGRMAEARSLIRQLPESDDDFARAKYMAEAQLLRDAKQWAEARAVLAEAGKRFPDDVDLLYEQSMLDERLGRLTEMEALLRRVIALKPDHHHAHNALGYSLAERNLRLPEAKALIQRALQLAPGEPFIMDSLGWVEYRLGNVREGLRLLQSAYRSRPDPEIGAHLGELLWVTGQQDEARRIWREARSRDQSNDVLRETLVRLKADL